MKRLIPFQEKHDPAPWLPRNYFIIYARPEISSFSMQIRKNVTLPHFRGCM